MKRLTALVLTLVLLCSLAMAEQTRTYAGYVYIEAGGMFRWFGLAATEEESYEIPITQQLADGTIVENVLLVTDKGIMMHSATCENQDCVGQGYVTLDNMGDRILGGCIICLPQQVLVELFTPEGFQAWYNDYMLTYGQ